MMQNILSRRSINPIPLENQISDYACCAKEHPQLRWNATCSSFPWTRNPFTRRYLMSGMIPLSQPLSSSAGKPFLLPSIWRPHSEPFDWKTVTGLSEPMPYVSSKLIKMREAIKSVKWVEYTPRLKGSLYGWGLRLRKPT